MLSLLALGATGCRGPRSRAESIELATSPLRNARTGQECRYRSLRDDGNGKPLIPEEWTFAVTSVGGGVAFIVVSVWGPERLPPSPSPREPGYEIRMQMKDVGFTGKELLRIFHRPELSPRGMRTSLDEEFKSVSASQRKLPLELEGRTVEGDELTIHFSDRTTQGSYKVVIVDEVPVIGIHSAELDESWEVIDPDGNTRTEHRHERLELVSVRR